MISLDVEEYCMNCPNFDADVNKTSWSTGEVSTKIRCTHSRQCYEIKKYLERPTKKPEETHIKCVDTCITCAYHLIHGSKCGKIGSSDCLGCYMYQPSGRCKCTTVELNTPCPYYKPNT